MNKLLLILLIFAGLSLAQEPVLIIMKSTPVSGLESETNALPEIISSKIGKNQKYHLVMWDEIESRLGKDKMAEINRCHDSVCISNFTAILERAGLHPTYMLFSTIKKSDSDYNITLEIADAKKGIVLGMVTTTISSLESFHSSGIVENIIRKISIYSAKNSGSEAVKINLFAGLNALDKDTSYYTQLINMPKELKMYVNFFSYHDERNKLFINTIQSTDTMRFPSILICKKDPHDTATTSALIKITFIDSISKSNNNLADSILFFKNASNTIQQVIMRSDVPMQTRYASEYRDLKTRMIDKIKNADFSFEKSDSSSGLYGVKYHYYYHLAKQKEVQLLFSADVSSFRVIVEKK